MSDFSELVTLAAALDLAATGAIRKAEAAVSKTAFEVERGAKWRAPVDTGFLRNSVSTTIRGLTAEVGPTASYGAHVEYGTYRMRPQPYMGPSTDAATPGFVKAMEQIGAKIL